MYATFRVLKNVCCTSLLQMSTSCNCVQKRWHRWITIARLPLLNLWRTTKPFDHYKFPILFYKFHEKNYTKVTITDVRGRGRLSTSLPSPLSMVREWLIAYRETGSVRRTISRARFWSGHPKARPTLSPQYGLIDNRTVRVRFDGVIHSHACGADVSADVPWHPRHFHPLSISSFERAHVCMHVPSEERWIERCSCTWVGVHERFPCIREYKATSGLSRPENRGEPRSMINRRLAN